MSKCLKIVKYKDLPGETAICLALDDKLKIYHLKLTTDTLFDLDKVLVSIRQDTRNTWLQRPRRQSARVNETDTLYNLSINLEMQG
jgi:hypothetical protein